MEDMKIVTLRFRSWELQHDRHFLIKSNITAEEVRQKYNKCIDSLKKQELDKQEEEEFVLNYLKEEYGWELVISDFIICDVYKTFGKIQNQEFNKVYLEEK